MMMVDMLANVRVTFVPEIRAVIYVCVSLYLQMKLFALCEFLCTTMQSVRHCMCAQVFGISCAATGSLFDDATALFCV